MQTEATRCDTDTEIQDCASSFRSDAIKCHELQERCDQMCTRIQGQEFVKTILYCIAHTVLYCIPQSMASMLRT
jgi:hypothetical protein